MTTISQQEMLKLQTYLQTKFGNKTLTKRPRGKATDSVEVLLDGEFIGTLYKDEEDGEISYDFNMAILGVDVGLAA